MPMLCVHRSAFVNDSGRCRPKCFHYIFRCRQAGLAKSMACPHEYLFCSLRLSKLGLKLGTIMTQSRGKPRRSGRGRIARTAESSFELISVWCLLLFDVLANDGNRRTATT